MLNTIEDYYQHLETDLTIQHDNSLSVQLINLRNKVEEPTEKTFYSYELFVADYKFENGGLKLVITALLRLGNYLPLKE